MNIQYDDEILLMYHESVADYAWWSIIATGVDDYKLFMVPYICKGLWFLQNFKFSLRDNYV